MQSDIGQPPAAAMRGPTFDCLAAPGYAPLCDPPHAESSAAATPPVKAQRQKLTCFIFCFLLAAFAAGAPSVLRQSYAQK